MYKNAHRNGSLQGIKKNFSDLSEFVENREEEKLIIIVWMVTRMGALFTSQEISISWCLFVVCHILHLLPDRDFQVDMYISASIAVQLKSFAYPIFKIDMFCLSRNGWLSLP